MISQRARALKPSPTLALAARAKALAAEGKDVVSLTVGEPDWETFAAASEAGIDAIKTGKTKYTQASGIPELRAAIAKELTDQLGFSCSADNVVVGTGAKFVLYSGFQMLLDVGDEVIIPAPYWVSYPAMVELSGGQPVVAECRSGENFKLTATNLKKSLTAKSKALVLCSPGNPTGICYSRSELEAIAIELRAHPKVVIISDDIYNRLIFSDQKLAPHLLHVAPDLKDRTIVVNGAAKTYSMTGWRIGWGLGPSEVMKAMADFLSQTTSSVSTISQYAAMAALQKCEADVLHSRKLLKEKLIGFQTRMEKIDGLKIFPPDGAFYLWISVENWIGKKLMKSGQAIQSSKQIAEILLNEFYLATVPGEEFGSPGYLRLSFATQVENLNKAVTRFQKFRESLT